MLSTYKNKLHLCILVHCMQNCKLGLKTIPLEITSNHLGEDYYILDESLSSKYVVIVKEDSNFLSPELITIVDSPPNETHRSSLIIDLSNQFMERNDQDRSYYMNDAPKGGRSIFSVLNTMKKQNTITKILGRIKEVVKVNEIPRHHDGEIAFEFPPTMGKLHAMDSMEQKYDPHWWSKPQTSNIVFPKVCRQSQCLGVLKCANELCPRLVHYKTSNTSYFNGSMLRAPNTSESCNNVGGKLVCHYCSHVAMCVGTRNSIVYYVMPSDESVSRLMIHSGNHDHNVREGTSKQLMDRTKGNGLKGPWSRSPCTC